MSRCLRKTDDLVAEADGASDRVRLSLAAGLLALIMDGLDLVAQIGGKRGVGREPRAQIKTGLGHRAASPQWLSFTLCATWIPG